MYIYIFHILKCHSTFHVNSEWQKESNVRESKAKRNLNFSTQNERKRRSNENYENVIKTGEHSPTHTISSEAEAFCGSKLEALWRTVKEWKEKLFITANNSLHGTNRVNYGFCIFLNFIFLILSSHLASDQIFPGKSWHSGLPRDVNHVVFHSVRFEWTEIANDTNGSEK